MPENDGRRSSSNSDRRMILAPEDGEVVFVFETKHALGFQTDSQMALLLHIGIDTVALNGQGFEVFVETDRKVKKGSR